MNPPQASASGSTGGSARWAEGDRVGQYRIIRHVGSGNMGDVYLARDLRLEREVALKFLRSGTAPQEDVRTRLLEEARAASAIHHPNVVAVFAVEEADDQVFLVMEFVEGTPLSQYLSRGALSTGEATSFAIQIADGLAAAHELKVCHRDLKPANIMVQSGGHIKIMDFGIAARGALPTSGEESSSSGTPAYMSPEQVLGHDADERADVFVAGLLMYEMLAGTRPFGGSYEAAMAYAIANEEPPPLSSHRPDVDPATEALVHQTLAKNPADRPASAVDLAARLRQVSGTSSSDDDGTAMRLLKKVAIPALIVIVGIAVWQKMYPTGGGTDDGNGDQTRLAVLPFELLGPQEDAHIAQGMTDAVTTRLLRIASLGVISPSSARQYAHTNKSARQIAAELEVTYLVRGTVELDKMHVPIRLRISPELVRAEDNTTIWKREYLRILDDIFELQAEIAENVVESLNLVLPTTDSTVLRFRPTDNVAAYDLYLRGNAYFSRGWKEHDILPAQALYERALALDSSFAMAWAMLSRCHSSMYWEYYDHVEARCEAAEAASARAVALAGDQAEPRLARGYYYYHCHQDFDLALSEFFTGLSHNPNHSELLNAIGAVQRRIPDLPAAVRSFTQALEFNPRSHLMAFDVALTYGMMRDYPRAYEYLERAATIAADIAPDFLDMPYVYKAWLLIIERGDVDAARAVLESAPRLARLRSSEYYWWLTRIVYDDYGAHLGHRPDDVDTIRYHVTVGRLYRLQGDTVRSVAHYDTARTWLLPRVRSQPDAAKFFSWLGLAYAGLGRADSALIFGSQALAIQSPERESFDAPFMVVNFAEILVMVGDYDRAVQQLEFLLTLPGFVSIPYMRADPLWRPLAGHPGFQALLASDST